MTLRTIIPDLTKEPLNQITLLGKKVFLESKKEYLVHILSKKDVEI